MLIRFNVSNFLSFDEETEFNMLAAKSLRTHKEHVYSIKKDLDLLKASAIYGANGAGKSNLVRAMHCLKTIVSSGVVPSNIFDKKFRLKEENKQKPVFYEVEFSINKEIYSYGILFDSNLVLEEWLYETGTAKPRMIFERKYSKNKKQSEIKVDEKYGKTPKFKMLISLMEENLLKQNELLVSKNENLKIEEIENFLNWNNHHLKIIYPTSIPGLFKRQLYKDATVRKFSEDLLKTFGVGVDSFNFREEDLDVFLSRVDILKTNEDREEMKADLDRNRIYDFSVTGYPAIAVKEGNRYLAKHLNTVHQINNKNVLFELEEESDGTRRLVDFIPLLFSLINLEITYIIDEIDRSLHPSLLHILIKKIMDDNTTKGQLIFTTHESSLLNCKVFRSDEIWFAEKNRDTQSTELYTLNEFKPRHDLDIEKGYLNGRFGAIPFLSKLEELNWHEQ